MTPNTQHCEDVRLWLEYWQQVRAEEAQEPASQLDKATDELKAIRSLVIGYMHPAGPLPNKSPGRIPIAGSILKMVTIAHLIMRDKDTARVQIEYEDLAEIVGCEPHIAFLAVSELVQLGILKRLPKPAWSAAPTPVRLTYESLQAARKVGDTVLQGGDV